MGHVVIELTNRCNLACHHCFSGRHGGRTDLPLEALDQVLEGARPSGFDQLSFTGGDPTLHRSFFEILRRTHAAGYPFGFVTNGWNFAEVFPGLTPYRALLQGVTFSIDGAAEVLEGFTVAGFTAALIGSLLYSACSVVIDAAVERIFSPAGP